MGILDRMEARGGGTLDHLNRMQSRSALGRMEGRSRRSTIDPQRQLEALTGQFRLEEKKERSYLSRVIHNAPHDITEFLSGMKEIAGLGFGAIYDLGVRLPYNYSTLDEKEVNGILDHYRKAPEAIASVLEDEVRRVAHVYGSAVAFTSTFGQAGSLDPLKEEFAENPLFTLLDVAAIGKAASAPARIGARSLLGKTVADASATSIRRALPGSKVFDDFRVPGLEGTTKYSEELRRMAGARLPGVQVGDEVFTGQRIAIHGKSARDLVREGADPKKAAMHEVIHNPEYRDLTIQERLAEVRRLTPVMGEHAKTFKHATVLNKMDEWTQDLTNPYRLAWKTLGKTPGFKRIREVLDNKGSALTVVSANSRTANHLKNLYRRNIAPALSKFDALDETGKAQVIHAMQSVSSDVDALTPDQFAAYTGLKRIGEHMRPRVARVMTTKGDLTYQEAFDILDERLMGNAVTGEARARLVEGNLTPSEQVVYERLSKLGNADKSVRKGAKELKKEFDALMKVANPDPETLAKIDRKSLELQLVDMAEERLARKQLAFIPGQRDFVELTKLQPGAVPDFLKGPAPDIDKLVTRKIKAKHDIVIDPLSFEDNMLRYVDFVAHTQGQLKLLDDVRAVSTSIAKNDIQHMLFENAAAKIDGKNVNFELLELPDGEIVSVPKGMKGIYEKAFSPDRPGAGLAAVDFTRNEFAKVVLLMNPGWVMYNLLGNMELYALAAGNPLTLGRSIGMKVSDGLYQKFFAAKGKHPVGRVGHMLKKLSEDWRELVPQSQALGMVQAETRQFGTIEYYTAGKISWGDSGYARLATQYAKLTDKVTGKLGLSQLNEGIEEVFRSALWLSTAQRKIAAKQFFETGKLLHGIDNSRADLMKLADEFDPRKMEVPGATVLSPEAQMTRDNVNRFLNDYYRLGPVERGLMRRVFPFYSWLKFSNKLASELPMNHPMRLSLAAFATNAVNDARAMDENLPEWLRDAVAVQEHDDGTTTFQTAGTEVFQGVLFGKEGFSRLPLGMNPILKMGIEFTTGVNLMRQGSNRVSPSRAAHGMIQAYGGNDTYEFTESGIQKVTPRPRVDLALLRSGLVPLPFSRQAEKLIRGGPHDDVGTVTELAWELGNILTGQPRHFPGAYLDKETHEPYETGSKRDLLGTGFGISRFTIDVEAMRQRETEKRLSAAKQRAAQQELERMLYGNNRNQ